MKRWNRGISLSGLNAVLAGFLFCAACTPAEDYIVPPEITVFSPFEGQSCGYGDTLLIEAKVTHPARIDFVRVSLLGTAGQPVAPSMDFVAGVTEYNLNAYISLDNLLLASGNLTLQVRAYAGDVSSGAWITINYQQLEKSLEAFVTVCKNGADSYSVYRTGLNQETDLLYTFDGDYSGSGISSSKQLVYTCGSQTGSLMAWNLQNGTAKWSVPAVPAPPLPYFNSVYCTENEVFISIRDGYIQGYDAGGMATYRSSVFTNGRFTHMVRTQGWLAAIFEPYHGNLSSLVLFNYPGGTVHKQVQFSGKAAGLGTFGKEGVVLYVNETNGCRARLFSYSLNTFVTIREFPFTEIKNVTGDFTTHTFLSAGKDVWWFRSASGSLVHYIQQGEINAMVYDSIGNLLFVSSGYHTGVYRIPDNHPVYTFASDKEIVDIHLLYNR